MSREKIPGDMLNWLDGMRENFGRVTLKHIKTPDYEAGSEACVSRGTESNADLARRVCSEHEAAVRGEKGKAA